MAALADTDTGFRIEDPLVHCGGGQPVALADLIGVSAQGDMLTLHAAPSSAAGGCCAESAGSRRLQSRPVRCETAAQAQLLADDVLRAAGLPQRGPRRLLVVVNPLSGRRRGEAVWESVRPIFEASGAVLDVRVTTTAGEAQQLARDVDIGSVSAIVCVSGDGMLHEVINGLMARPDCDAAAAAVSVAAVPAGSGNSLTCSILKGAGERLDPSSAAFLICRGATYASQPPTRRLQRFTHSCRGTR